MTWAARIESLNHSPVWFPPAVEASDPPRDPSAALTAPETFTVQPVTECCAGSVCQTPETFTIQPVTECRAGSVCQTPETFTVQPVTECRAGSVCQTPETFTVQPVTECCAGSVCQTPETFTVQPVAECCAGSVCQTHCNGRDTVLDLKQTYFNGKKHAESEVNINRWNFTESKSKMHQ